MKDIEIEEKLRLLEKEISLLGEEFERQRFDLKGELDSIRIEVEVLKGLLERIIPDFKEQYLATKDKTLREFDPEWRPKKSRID